MKLVRFGYQGSSFWGELEGDTVYTTGGLAGTRTGDKFLLSQVQLLAPVEPSKIICVGRNYLDHIKEMGNMVSTGDLPKEPGLFLKAPNTLERDRAQVAYPSWTENLHYEGELALIIGKGGKNIAADTALEHVLGYTCALDITARDKQKSDLQWTRGKSADQFCPIGPWIVTGLHPTDAAIQTRVNGEIRQNSRTSMMIFDIATVISYVSGFMTLNVGDVVLTGTPEGVGALHPGDTVEVEVEHVGVLTTFIV